MQLWAARFFHSSQANIGWHGSKKKEPIQRHARMFKTSRGTPTKEVLKRNGEHLLKKQNVGSSSLQRLPIYNAT